MEQKIALVVLVFVLVQFDSLVTSFNLPDLLDNEKYDEGAYERMLPDDEILLSRRRQDPDTDEGFWQDDDTKSTSSSSVSFTSNMDDAKNIIALNGIDISNLPPNYHNTTTITRKVGGKTVTVNVTIDKTTDPATGLASLSVIETSSSNGVGRQGCTDSKSCGVGKYCQRLVFGDFCNKCRNRTQRCNSNEECCGTKGALCVSGICQTGFKQGQPGTICKSRSDCDTGTCCARQFMEPTGKCKLLAKKGEKCINFPGGISTIISSGLCPCQSGLECSRGGIFENLFGESMNDILGDNTCRTGSTKRRLSRWSSFRMFDEPRDDVVGDDFRR